MVFLTSSIDFKMPTVWLGQVRWAALNAKITNMDFLFFLINIISPNFNTFISMIQGLFYTITVMMKKL